MKYQNYGFTLIELVIVITIIGILSAIALPRFASLQTEARIAKMNGALGAMKSAAAMAHANLIARGNPSSLNGNPPIGVSDVNMEGVDVDFVNGYPAAVDIALLAGIMAPDYAEPDLTTPGSAIIRSDLNHPNCSIVYREAQIGNQPTYIINLQIADCQ